MLARNGAGGEQQLTGDRGFVAGDFPASLSVEVEYPLGVVVELLACIRKEDSTALPLEQGRAEHLFEGLHTLADRRLGQAQRLGGAGEAAQLSSLRKRAQMCQLQVFGRYSVHTGSSSCSLSPSILAGNLTHWRTTVAGPGQRLRRAKYAPNTDVRSQLSRLEHRRISITART